MSLLSFLPFMSWWNNGFSCAEGNVFPKTAALPIYINKHKLYGEKDFQQFFLSDFVSSTPDLMRAINVASRQSRLCSSS